MQNCLRRGDQIRAWNWLESAGKSLPPPALWSGGGVRTIPIAVLDVPPIQFWIQVVIMVAHSCALARKQLWPPPTLTTSSDWAGLVKFTSGPVAWYARLTSSERANSGACPPALGQPPQRSEPLMLVQRLVWND